TCATDLVALETPGGGSTTTTSTTGAASTTAPASTTTSTTSPSAGTVLKGALLAGVGRFIYNATPGLPGANAACDDNFPGTHACTVSDLAAAQAAGDLVNLKDIGSNTVTSFWAIDPAADPLQQCNDDALGGSGLNWEYATAHTASRGSKRSLSTTTWTLGPIVTGLQCNFSGNASVGCCL